MRKPWSFIFIVLFFLISAWWNQASQEKELLILDTQLSEHSSFITAVTNLANEAAVPCRTIILNNTPSPERLNTIQKAAKNAERVLILDEGLFRVNEVDRFKDFSSGIRLSFQTNEKGPSSILRLESWRSEGKNISSNTYLFNRGPNKPLPEANKQLALKIIQKHFFF